MVFKQIKIVNKGKQISNMYFYELNIAYDGTLFYGSARQKKFRTVEGEIIRCFKKIFNDTFFEITFAGRTDRYVHAENQTVSLSIEKKIKFSKDKFISILNKIFPPDISIIDIRCHKTFFNARFDAISRTYKYVLELPPHNIFVRNYVYPYSLNINLNLIKKIKEIFVGEHDFLSFSTSEKSNTIRRISKFVISKKNNLIIFKITANGFLRSQIRMMIAALLKVNEQKVTVDHLKHLLENPKKGSIGFKVSGSGLYFLKAKYK